MPMKQTGRKQYRSMQGKSVDMDLLRQRNELTPAVGNAKVNARGDELGPGGKIMKTKEEVLKEYYENNPGVPDEIAVKKPSVTEEEIVETTSKKTSVKTSSKVEDDWVEDDDGNFVQKGE